MVRLIFVVPYLFTACVLAVVAFVLGLTPEALKASVAEVFHRQEALYARDRVVVAIIEE